MRFTRLHLESWRNFLKVDVPLQDRMFLVGPNASGKSNLLDAFRFLRDIAEPQGGLSRAVEHPSRRGVSQIRSLHAKRQSNVILEVEVALGDGEPWIYRLEFSQDNRRRPIVKREVVRQGGTILLERPNREDEADPERLTQTHLEQVNTNRSFRKLVDFLARVRYLHLVPQLVREPDRSVGRHKDPYGGDFLEQLALTSKKTLEARLNRICEALRIAVPQLKKLTLERDERGVAHLKGLYEHWRPNAGWQTEEQFSDGTLRLLALLWVFLEGKEPLLLEEPELSLHPAVVRCFPQMLARVKRKTGRQVLLSTHSGDILRDEGVGAEEILMLQPQAEGTAVQVAASLEEVRLLLEGGLSPADVVLSRTAPQNAHQLTLFAS